MTILEVNECFLRDEDWKSAEAAFRRVVDSSSSSITQNGSGDDSGPVVRAFSDPFPTVAVRNFLKDRKLVADLAAHLLTNADYDDRNNDLFQFRQTAALVPDADEKKSSTETATNGRAGANGAGDDDPVAAFKRALKEVVKPRLESVSGIELDDRIFLSSSIYEYTDTLLCHDDDLEERRIAFIYYLTPEDWSEEDGGQLDLFACHDDRTPGGVVRSLLPERNSFAFFHVSYKSFHQVREVLAKDKTRLSLNGWFHGAPLKRPPPPPELVPVFRKPGDFPEKDLFDWINPLFLSPEVQSQVCDEFGESSEIRIAGFLSEDVYEKLCDAFDQVSDDHWATAGPVNRRRYRRWEGGSEDGDGSASSLIAKLKQFLESDAFFLVLSQLTGLELHPLAAEADEGGGGEDEGPSTSKKQKVVSAKKGQSDESVCNVEIREMSRGCYTLLCDRDPVGDVDALEVSLFFNVPENPDDVEDEDEDVDDEQLEGSGGDGDEDDEERDARRAKVASEKREVGGEGGCEKKPGPVDFGGYVSYVPRNEKEEMLRIPPLPNTLAMVYRCKDTMKFTKYVNCRIDEVMGPDAKFQHVVGLYVEGHEAAAAGFQAVD